MFIQMETIILFLILITSITCDVNHLNLNTDNNNVKSKLWWEKTIFYQIYPRSFKDTNGDGIGDLRGIIENIQHLKNAGIGATWLSPIYKSPMADFGYDVSDFYNIDEIFGTMEDLDNLIIKAHELDIKIILDIIPNHSSDECEWFQKSVNREDGWEDFYIWNDGITINATHKIPPNNWVSVFHGSAWTWNNKRQQYYYHQFTPKQPDLNYRNQLVINEMTNVLNYWINKDIDGFRIDAVNHLFEDELLRDEPIIKDRNPNLYYSKEHIYTLNYNECYEFIANWTEIINEWNVNNPTKTEKMFMTEAYANFNDTIRWYENNGRKIGDFPFNFGLIMDINSESTATDFKNLIDKWINKMPKWSNANWVLGNHDMVRVNTRYPNRGDSMNILLLTLPGIAVTYYGEEIGMTDYRNITWKETQDPWACQSNDPELYQKFTRDPIRTPFQWDNTTNAGFSTGNKTWIPVHSNYMDINLKKQMESERSFFKLYQGLANLRQENTFLYGDFKSKAYDNVFAYTRSYQNYTHYGIAINVGGITEIIDMTEIESLPENTVAHIIFTSVDSRKTVGSNLNARELQIEPNEAIVFNLQYS